MKKLKINLLPIIGMMVAVATLAFTAPKENDGVWYEVNSNGTINQTPDSTLPFLCPEENTTKHCAIMLEESTPPPATIQDTDVEGGPVTTLDHRFREKP